MKLKQVTDFLDNYLRIEEIPDEAWNGLQVQGKDEVNRIMLAVDSGIEVFEKAAEIKADMVIVHHGHFWKSVSPLITGWSKKRIEALLKNGISLYVAHLPLDLHPDIGNNAQLLKLLGAGKQQEFAKHHDFFISWTGKFKTPMTCEDIRAILDTKLGADCKVLQFGRFHNETVAVCSGGGDYVTFTEALEKKADVYITGDARDIYHIAKDAGINVIFAGHHASEILGVKALAEVITKKLKIETEFINIQTGL